MYEKPWADTLPRLHTTLGALRADFLRFYGRDLYKLARKASGDWLELAGGLIHYEGAYAHLWEQSPAHELAKARREGTAPKASQLPALSSDETPDEKRARKRAELKAARELESSRG